MSLALLLLFGLHYLSKYCADLDNFGIDFKPDPMALRLTRILLATGFVQVLLGTQVREQVDHYLRDTELTARSTVIAQLNWTFYTHRSFSVVFIALLVWSIYRLHRHDPSGSALTRARIILGLVLLNVGSGIGLNYFGFPAQLQPPHLFVGVLIMGLLFQQLLNQKGTLISS